MDIKRESDDDGLRWYSDGDVSVLSVTTVLSFLEEDDSGLEIWKQRNDGEDGNPHHEHIFWYSGPRGTLCHYHALSQFEDSFDGEDMWDYEEASAMGKITGGPATDEFADASTDLNDVTYSVLRYRDAVTSRDQYDDFFADTTRLVDVLHDDIEWFVETFERVCDELGVDTESVCRVEQYLLDDEHGFGGQCDLLYEDPDGNTVLADLKTSSGLRQKHRLQSVAYMKAIEQAEWGPETVDRVEVWRLYPDDREWQIHSHEVPSHVEHLHDEDEPEAAHYTDAYWFEDKYGDFTYDSLQDMWVTFSELVVRATRESTDEDT